MINRIFLDMDDVLADLTVAAMRHMGLHDWTRKDYTIKARDIHEMYRQATGISYTPAQFWEHFKREFWSSIPPTPWCDDLIDLCLEYVNPEGLAVLTSPTKCGDCLAGKLDWIAEFLPPFLHRQYVMAPRKYYCSSVGAILIDDAFENTGSFSTDPGGGFGITFPQPWNPSRQHVGEELRYVQRWLEYNKNYT